MTQLFGNLVLGKLIKLFSLKRLMLDPILVLLQVITKNHMTQNYIHNNYKSRQQILRTRELNSRRQKQTALPNVHRGFAYNQKVAL